MFDQNSFIESYFDWLMTQNKLQRIEPLQDTIELRLSIEMVPFTVKPNHHYDKFIDECRLYLFEPLRLDSRWIHDAKTD